MITAHETSQSLRADPVNWRVAVMDFVDDFRFHRDPAAAAQPPVAVDARLDAMLASVTETLCREIGVEPPAWALHTPACPRPWFVSGMESLKAIALAESPLPFRIRQIFVLENFLTRV